MTILEIEQIIDVYNTGQYTIKELACMNGVSVGKMFNELKKAGCVFNRKWRRPMSEERRKAISKANKGKTISEEQRRIISERNSCNFNGLNGYGHTKTHNLGYVLAYAPKHPKAHKDGYVMLHTVVMERAIGRYLKDNEVVHHENHNRKDNRLENLVLMDKHEHCSMHMRERHMKRRGNDLSIA